MRRSLEGLGRGLGLVDGGVGGGGPAEADISVNTCAHDSGMGWLCLSWPEYPLGFSLKANVNA